MRPYFDDGQSVIYHADCRKVLPLLDEPVDLILTDPPYGVDFQSGRRSERHSKIEGDDGSLDVPAALTLACRSLKPHRHTYVFGPIDLRNTPLTAQVELI